MPYDLPQIKTEPRWEAMAPPCRFFFSFSYWAMHGLFRHLEEYVGPSVSRLKFVFKIATRPAHLILPNYI
jgi:hypothetical protein